MYTIIRAKIINYTISDMDKSNTRYTTAPSRTNIIKKKYSKSIKSKYELLIRF